MRKNGEEFECNSFFQMPCKPIKNQYHKVTRSLKHFKFLGRSSARYITQSTFSSGKLRYESGSPVISANSLVKKKRALFLGGHRLTTSVLRNLVGIFANVVQCWRACVCKHVLLREVWLYHPCQRWAIFSHPDVVKAFTI